MVSIMVNTRSSNKNNEEKTAVSDKTKFHFKKSNKSLVTSKSLRELYKLEDDIVNKFEEKILEQWCSGYHYCTTSFN